MRVLEICLLLVAMNLTKLLKRPPRKIAEDIVERCRYSRIFEKIEIAGPGFINFTFPRSFIFEELHKLIASGEASLIENIGRGKEYR